MLLPVIPDRLVPRGSPKRLWPGSATPALCATQRLKPYEPKGGLGRLLGPTLSTTSAPSAASKTPAEPV